MTFEDARRAAIELLETRGQLLNGHLLRLVKGDKVLFREVRDSLIRDHLAEDRSNVGLALISRDATAASVKPGVALTNSDSQQIVNSFHPASAHQETEVETVEATSEWWVMTSGVIRGPFDKPTLWHMVQSGEIAPGDVVRKGSEGLWHQPIEIFPKIGEPDSQARIDPFARSGGARVGLKSSNAANGSDPQSTSTSPKHSGESAPAANDERTTSVQRFVPPEKAWSKGIERRPSRIRQSWDAAANLCGGSTRLWQILLTCLAIGLFMMWWRQPPPPLKIYQEFTDCYVSLQKLRERRIGRSEWAPTVNRFRPRIQSILSRLRFRRAPVEKELYLAGTTGLLPLLEIPADPTNAERIFDKHMSSVRRILDGPAAPGRTSGK